MSDTIFKSGRFSSGSVCGRRGGNRQRHRRLSGVKDLKGFGSTLPLSRAMRERELDYTQV